MKPYRWRLYADRSIEAEVVEHLRDAHVNVVSLGDAAGPGRRQGQRSPYRRARELKRYLLTRHEDFWDDERYPFQTCPGMIILATKGTWVGKWLVLVLRKVRRDFSRPSISVPPDRIKVRVAPESISVKIASGESQSRTTKTWTWTELFNRKAPGANPLSGFLGCQPDL